MADTMDAIKNMVAALTNLPPVPPMRAPFVLWFELQRRTPRAVMMLDARMPLVRMRTCYPELSEMQFDHASNTNMRCARTSDIDATYATALMGGEPYSEWN